jgi:hypothetical protein
MATIAVFLVLSGGTALALNGANTVFSQDIVNHQVKTQDIRKGAITSGKIANGKLKAVDVGQTQLVDFRVDYTGGKLDPSECTAQQIKIDAKGDHLLLTPSADDPPEFGYYIRYQRDSNNPQLVFCNHSDGRASLGTLHFNLLAFEAAH